MRVLSGLLFCATLAAQPATIEGTVVNHATGQPMPGVHLRFVTGDFMDGGVEQLYGAISDPAGHFSIGGLKAGIYFVSPERNGFVALPHAKATEGITVPLKPGQHLTDYKIEMTQAAIISGRVVDEYGDPVPRIQVELESASGGRDMSFFFFSMRSRTTDDLGSFRLSAAPGRYYVHANIYANGQPARVEIRTDGTPSGPFVSTYYPSATAKDTASVVEAGAGQDVAGLEIRLARGTAGAARGLTVSGVVLGLPANQTEARVTLRRGTDSEFYGSSESGAGSDGKFSFCCQQPGAYRISARYSSGKTILVSQTVDLTLDKSDETGVQLTLAPPAELTGRLTIDGDAAAAAQRAVRLEPSNRFGDGGGGDSGDAEVPPGVADASGGFVIAGVSSRQYRVVVDPMPENGYIASVTVDGTRAADDLVDFSHGMKNSRLDVAVKRDGAQISGAVVDQEGKPLVSPMVFIYLVDDPKKLKQMNPDDMNRPAEGKYAIKAIRPGKYRLFAIDTLSLAASMGDLSDDADQDAMTKALFDAAEEIEIKPGDKIVKDLKAVDKLPAKEQPHAAQ